MTADSTDIPVFEAFITPHRSLSGRGARTIVLVLLIISSGFALRFWLLGAWPVVIFSLADVPLIVLLLLVNFRRARASECLILTEQTLTIIRTDPAGVRRRILLPAAWLRVDLQDPDDVPHILLRSRGQSCEIAAFLPGPDKRELYDALKRALHGLRNPTFDNPQLRDD
jgi:uncharacterized membrane protein